MSEEKDRVDMLKMLWNIPAIVFGGLGTTIHPLFFIGAGFCFGYAFPLEYIKILLEKEGDSK